MSYSPSSAQQQQQEEEEYKIRYDDEYEEGEEEEDEYNNYHDQQQEQQDPTTFNDIEHALLAPLYDDKKPLEGFISPSVSKTNLSSMESGTYSSSRKSTPKEVPMPYYATTSRHQQQQPSLPSANKNQKPKVTKRKIITKRIVGGVPQLVSSATTKVQPQNNNNIMRQQQENNNKTSVPIMGLDDVVNNKNKKQQQQQQLKPSAAASSSSEKQQPKKKKKIVIVKSSGKKQKKQNQQNNNLSEAEKKLQQREEEESLAPLLHVQPPSNKEALSGWIPTKFVLLLVILVLGAIGYSIFSIVQGALSFGKENNNVGEEKCNTLTPTMGVRAVPYRMIVLASVTSVLFPLVINWIKYRKQNNVTEEENLLKKNSRQQQQQQQLQQSLLPGNKNNKRKNRNQKPTTTKLVTKTRLVERIRLVPVYGSGEEEDEEEIGEEEEAFEEEEEYEEEVEVYNDDDDDEEEEEEEQEQPRNPSFDERSLTNSSFLSQENNNNFDDEEETFSLTSERLPFLNSIKRNGYRELGWIFQTYGTIDGRWYLLVLLFAVVNFFYNIVQVSSGERDTTFQNSNVWERYQSSYMRWFQSGTVAVLGVFFSQFLTSIICFEIAGTPREIGEDNFLKKKLELLKRQRLASADQELILGSAATTSVRGKKISSSASNSSGGADSSGNSCGEEMKTQKKFAVSQQQLALNSQNSTNNNNPYFEDDEANQAKEESIKLQDMRSLSRVIANIPLPLATLLVSRSPENTETLTFTHVFLGGLLLYPGFITHVVPSLVVFLPMALLFIVPLAVCYIVARYELRPFAALVERENGKEVLCRRHRSSVICMILVARIVGTFVLTALFQTMMCYSAMFFIRGRISYADTIVNEVEYRDVDCFLWGITNESIYQWSLAGLIFS